MNNEREELYDALFQIAENYNVPLTNSPDMHREMPSIGDFCGDLEAAFRTAGYGVANGIKAQALREAAAEIRDTRPEVGTHINVPEYRQGKYDGLTLAAARLFQRADELEGEA